MPAIVGITVANVYHPRNPLKSYYFQCVQDNFKELQNIWDDRFASRCGYWRPYVSVSAPISAKNGF